MKNTLIVIGVVIGAFAICGAVFALILALRAGSARAPAPGYVESGVGGGYPAPAGDYRQALEAEVAAEAAYVDAASAEMPLDITVINAQQIERLIIRNGSISMVVEDTRAAKARIEQIVASMAAEGAFIVSSNEYGGAQNLPYINMSIRVPATRFDEVMDTLEGMAVQGTNPSVNEYSEDVTEEYVDIEARVASLQAARDRLLELMANAATTEDLLMAEQQLTQREAEIESLQGRMRYLAEAARLSRIDIELQPYILSQPVDTRWRPAETVRQAFDALVNGLRNFGDFLIYFAIAVLPWLVLFGLVIYGIVRFITWRVQVRRRKRAAREAAASQE